jgi:hypothetical protein
MAMHGVQTTIQTEGEEGPRREGDGSMKREEEFLEKSRELTKRICKFVDSEEPSLAIYSLLSSVALLISEIKDPKSANLLKEMATIALPEMIDRMTSVQKRYDKLN